jgi:excisionase family DNA binding protein
VALVGRDDETAAIFARVPRAQAEKLERLSYELKQPKQAVIAGLLARYPESGVPEVERHSFAPAEVVTLEQLAALLQLDVELVRGLAETGELPGRKLGDEWRFSRDAVLAWLGEGER